MPLWPRPRPAVLCAPLAALLLGPCLAAPSANESGAATLQSNASADTCRADVLRFEETIGFVRQNQGNDAARTLREKLLPKKLESDLLMGEGYCGLSRYLREKKLIR